MKYIILVGDGMADYPLKEFSNRTPLQVARTPNMDWVAGNGILGTVRLIPHGMQPGSDVANLSILGFNPKKKYPGRGPLEAAHIGCETKNDEVIFRCNFVTISDGTMVDYSAGHIKTEEGGRLIDILNKDFASHAEKFCKGVSYRNICIIKTWDKKELKGLCEVKCVPPHDIIGKHIKPYLPKGRYAPRIRDVMNLATFILEKQDINRIRIDLKENPANSIWLWGQGTKAQPMCFKERFGISGCVISGVDLIKGIGGIMGLDVINVEGATGYYDTNYKGQANAGLESLKKSDFVFIHVEAPDEASHNGDTREKIIAIERFDRMIVGPFIEYIKANPARLLVLPDHATPLSKRTHTSEPVCFAMAGSGIDICNPGLGFNESDAAKTGYNIEKGYELIGEMIKGSR